MFEFLFGSKKKVSNVPKVDDPDSIVPPKDAAKEPIAEIPPIVTKAFFFKFNVNYYSKNEVKTYVWSSEAYYDYRKALNASRSIIKDINEQLNTTDSNDYIFIVDLAIKKRKIIDATANDVQVVTFANGKAIKSDCIMVSEGENVILPMPEPNTYNIVR